MFKISLVFENLSDFVEILKLVLPEKAKKEPEEAEKEAEVEPEEVVNPKVEKRGGKIKELHKLAKEHKLSNPEMTYKECLKICGEQMKDKKNLV